MNRIKVYDVDGKPVAAFDKNQSKAQIMPSGYQTGTHRQRIAFLNARGFYVRGQVTSKGVTIK